MIGEDPAGTGTVMRSATVHGYAEQAGFSGFEVLRSKTTSIASID